MAWQIIANDSQSQSHREAQGPLIEALSAFPNELMKMIFNIIRMW
jgi:hypothetical protein